MTAEGTSSALSREPDLDGYPKYQWRTGSDAAYTVSTTKPYTYSEAHTYVEFSPEPITYTVSFDANGGSGTMADVTGVSGSYTLPACTFTAPVGKKFKEWYVDGTRYAVGNNITITANTNVIAVWEVDPDAGCYQTADFTIGDGTDALALLNVAKTAGAADSTWDKTNKILTLNGVNFTTSADTAVQLPGGSTIVLAEGTKNTITSTFESASDDSSSYGICVSNGNLTIEGSGQLAVKGGTAQYSDSIVVFSGSLTIDSGTVTATGGTAKVGSYGIYTDRGVTINGGTVTATGSKSGDGSHGIATNRDVTITGGTVIARGGNGGQASYGINTGSSYACTVTGGDVTAIGGNASEKSYGIDSRQYITISGGHVTAQTLGDASTTYRSALHCAPDLSGYAGCYWRTGPDDYYYNTAYPYSQAHTYVEFAPEGKLAPDTIDLPKTGDNSNVLLWIVLLLASGIGVTVVYGRRSKYAK